MGEGGEVQVSGENLGWTTEFWQEHFLLAQSECIRDAYYYTVYCNAFDQFASLRYKKDFFGTSVFSQFAVIMSTGQAYFYKLMRKLLFDRESTGSKTVAQKGKNIRSSVSWLKYSSTHCFFLKYLERCISVIHCIHSLLRKENLKQYLESLGDRIEDESYSILR